MLPQRPGVCKTPALLLSYVHNYYALYRFSWLIRQAIADVPFVPLMSSFLSCLVFVFKLVRVAGVALALFEV